MTFDEYGKSRVHWYVVGNALTHGPSDTFLDVGSIEESIDAG